MSERDNERLYKPFEADELRSVIQRIARAPRSAAKA